MYSWSFAWKTTITNLFRWLQKTLHYLLYSLGQLIVAKYKIEIFWFSSESISNNFAASFVWCNSQRLALPFLSQLTSLMVVKRAANSSLLAAPGPAVRHRGTVKNAHLGSPYRPRIASSHSSEKIISRLSEILGAHHFLYFYFNTFMNVYNKFVLIICYFRGYRIMLFIYLLPPFQATVFNATLGQDPTGLKIGVVNDELDPNQDRTCNNYTTDCTYSLLSCRYLRYITSNIVQVSLTF